MIRAHRAVLSSVSSVFERMLSSDLREKTQSLIVIDEFCLNTIHHLLHYAYSSQVEEDCDLQCLFAAAVKYQIYDLWKLFHRWFMNFHTLTFSSNCIVSTIFSISAYRNSRLAGKCWFRAFAKNHLPYENIHQIRNFFTLILWAGVPYTQDPMLVCLLH